MCWYTYIEATSGYCMCWYTYIVAYAAAANGGASMHVDFPAKLLIADSEFMNYLLHYLYMYSAVSARVS